MELPKVLQNMLNAVLETNVLKSWNIYQERDGMVSFMILLASQSSITSRPAASKGNLTNSWPGTMREVRYGIRIEVS